MSNGLLTPASGLPHVHSVERGVERQIYAWHAQDVAMSGTPSLTDIQPVAYVERTRELLWPRTLHCPDNLTLLTHEAIFDGKVIAKLKPVRSDTLFKSKKERWNDFRAERAIAKAIKNYGRSQE